MQLYRANDGRICAPRKWRKLINNPTEFLVITTGRVMVATPESNDEDNWESAIEDLKAITHDFEVHLGQLKSKKE